jgi:hypothetical protein
LFRVTGYRSRPRPFADAGMDCRYLSGVRGAAYAFRMNSPEPFDGHSIRGGLNFTGRTAPKQHKITAQAERIPCVGISASRSKAFVIPRDSRDRGGRRHLASVWYMET